MKLIGLRVFTSILGFGFILLSCSRKATEVALPLTPPPSFSDAGTMELPEKWWTTFEDPQLNSIVDSALANNFDLKTAWERLRAAHAVVERESSGLFPDIFANLQSGINFPQPDFRGGENTRLGLTADYEVDLWGRIRSAIDAEKYRTEATRAEYQTAALSLSAEIVRIWYQLATAENQLALVEEQIETNEKIVEFLEAQFGSGQIRSVDILRQRQFLRGTYEQKVIQESRIQVLQNQLAVLVGRSPQEAGQYTAPVLPDLPPLPETGIPIELVQRRPDVQQAFLLVQAADQDLASAISSQYPRLSLSASTSLRANTVDNLFESWAYSFAGSLLTPIFYGKELRAEVDRNEAVKQQRIYEYGQAILIAFREVEDALIQEKKQVERIEFIEEQLELARQSYEQLQVEYFNGFSEYLDVLTALDQEQQLRRDLLSANLALLEFRIALYRALAGSIDTGRTE